MAGRTAHQRMLPWWHGEPKDVEDGVKAHCGMLRGKQGALRDASKWVGGRTGGCREGGSAHRMVLRGRQATTEGVEMVARRARGC